MTFQTMPMFPLGSTVFPGQVVPLHVFEPRYRSLFSDLSRDDVAPTFGIVLIDRGFEVGGGDHRVDVATRVEILQAEEFDDGRWAVVTAGIERLDILEWLRDDPYPRAQVSRRLVADDGGSNLDDLEELLQRTIGLAAKSAGIDDPEPLEFSSDPMMRLDQLSAVAPLTEFDRQGILEATTTSRQMALLSEALLDKQVLIRAELDGE